jgi:hypothetical protein
MFAPEARRAREWYEAHKNHVSNLMRQATKRGATGFEPTGSDVIRPDLWKAEHWLWFKKSWGL